MGVHGHKATVRPEDYEPGAVGLLGDAIDRRFPDAARDALSRWEALPAAVRGLVTAVCLDRLDDEALGALADWLDEHGESGGARVRLLRPQAGDVLALWCNPPLNEPGGPEEQDRVYEAVVRPRGLLPIFLSPHEDRIEVMDMKRIHDGWVRAEEADERVRQATRAETEACARVVLECRVNGLTDGLAAPAFAEAIRSRLGGPP